MDRQVNQLQIIKIKQFIVHKKNINQKMNKKKINFKPHSLKETIIIAMK